MSDIDKYELVNKCETLDELSDAIKSIADGADIIGRTESFNASFMAKLCKTYSLNNHNVLTRKYGIRQQAMMILFYKDK